MKCKYLALGLCLISMQGFSQTLNNKQQGDEEGPLDLTTHFDLPQDRKAVEEAMSGWWTQTQKNWKERTQWYAHDRFGCFVHWGIYASAAGYWKGKMSPGYSEHLMRKEKIPLQEYKDSLVYPFNPVDFDADAWMQTVKNAGMKYFIITAKHHDGFAMYPSDAYPYDIRLTKYGRDPMMQLRDAARRYGIKFGFYYSHAFDWEHPSAPGNDWEYDHPGGDKKLGGDAWWKDNHYKAYLDSVDLYVKQKSIPQIQELIRIYHPDIMWFDTPAKLPLYQNIRILEALREVDPNNDIVVNGRLVRFGNQNMGDYRNTGDRAAYFYPVSGLWESIPTTNESYGYNAADVHHKDIKHFVQLLETAVSKGGNILMNIGPMGNGRIDEADINILHGIGNWMKTNNESIYGNDRSGLPLQSWGVTTLKGDTLYAHIHEWPKDGQLVIGGLSGKIKKGWFLGDNSRRLKWTKVGADDTRLSFAGSPVDTMSTVVALIIDGKLGTNNLRLLNPKTSNTLYAFDAQLHGGGLGYGDGKTNRNYVNNWTRNDQSLSWNFRLSAPATYKILLDYNTNNATDKGEIVVMIDNKHWTVPYEGFTERQGTNSKFVATIDLLPGKHTCQLKGKSHHGKEYLQPIAIRLDR